MLKKLKIQINLWNYIQKQFRIRTIKAFNLDLIPCILSWRKTTMSEIINNADNTYHKLLKDVIENGELVTTRAVLQSTGRPVGAYRPVNGPCKHTVFGRWKVCGFYQKGAVSK